MGKARFIWRERALYLGVPVGLAVVFVVGGWRLRAVSDLVSSSAVTGFWVPLAVSIFAGALVGLAEWDHESRQSGSGGGAR